MKLSASARFFCAFLLAGTFSEPTCAQDKTEDSSGYHPAPSPHEGKKRPLPTLTTEGKSEIVVIAIDKTVELGLAAYVRRGVEEHQDAALIVLDVNTLGGRVDAAIQIRDALLDAKPPTVAFIHPRAISAGALISLACDTIVMSKGATIGAATPISSQGELKGDVAEKMTSYMRAEMRATAEANGRRGDIAEAMVDASVVIDGVTENGKLMTLDTDRAIDLGMADLVADNLDDVLKKLGANEPSVTNLETNWGEVIARWLTEPTVSGLLMSIGMLGLMIAFYTRTVGAFTVAGFVCLALFFGGHAIVNLVGWEELLLFIAGATLMLIEVVAIPGFGFIGVAGLAALAAALALSLDGLPLDVSFEVGTLATAMARVLLSLIGSIAGLFLAFRLLPKTAIGRGLVLETQMVGKSARELPPSAVGSIGMAITDLQPSGKIEIDGQRYDATSERVYIVRGTPIKVVRLHENALVVRAHEEETE